MKWKDEIGIEVPGRSHFWKLGSLGKVKRQYLPNFFIISPPKTASTWLSYNLNCHPEIFIPEVKEIKYFSNHWRTEKFNWYLKHFKKAIKKKKGDASPPYAILPIHTIQFIKLLIPGLKLIFLMRDPVDRAWSHTKHSYKYREPGFKSYTDDFDSVSDESLIDAFGHDWFLAPADYLSCLKRWLTVFPKDQFYLGFYENIKDNPKKLLVDIFDFIGVEKKVDWSQFRIYETIFAGNRRKLPNNLKTILRSLHQKRTQQLAQFLKGQFNIDIPAYWEKTLAETDRCSSPCLIEAGYRGLNIYKYERRFYAVPQGIGDIDISIADLNKYMERGKCIAENNFYKTRYLANQQLSMLLQKEHQKVIKRLESKSENKENFPNVFHGEFTDKQLANILDMDNIHTSPLIWGRFMWFNIVRYKGHYYALSGTLGNIDLTQVDDDKLDLYRKNGHCTVRNSPFKTKASIILLIITKASIFLLIIKKISIFCKRKIVEVYHKS